MCRHLVNKGILTHIVQDKFSIPVPTIEFRVPF